MLLLLLLLLLKLLRMRRLENLLLPQVLPIHLLLLHLLVLPIHFLLSLLVDQPLDVLLLLLDLELLSQLILMLLVQVELMLTILLFLLGIGVVIANSTTDRGRYIYSGLSALDFHLRVTIPGVLGGRSILLGRFIFISGGCRCFTLGVCLLRLLGLFLLLSYCLLACLSGSSSLVRLSGGLGHFFFLPRDTFLVVVKIILDLGSRTCSHGFGNHSPVVTMLIQCIKKQLLLPLLPLLRFNHRRLLMFFLPIAVIAAAHWLHLRFRLMNLLRIFILAIRGIGGSSSLGSRSSSRGSSRGSSLLGHRSRLSLRRIMILRRLAMFEILLLVGIQYEPIAALALPMMCLDFIRLLGIQNRFGKTGKYLQPHGVEVLGVVGVVVFGQDEFERILGRGTGPDDRPHGKAGLDRGVPRHDVSAPFLPLEEFFQGMLVGYGFFRIVVEFDAVLRGLVL
mmetsp:Transcript_29899/g.55180  ORF Transcript_29899/g.55180 Transcript_29899/m.55180 type:complete len:450 (-) Transcript_29899:3566-4915(-)